MKAGDTGTDDQGRMFTAIPMKPLKKLYLKMEETIGKELHALITIAITEDHQHGISGVTRHEGHFDMVDQHGMEATIALIGTKLGIELLQDSPEFSDALKEMMQDEGYRIVSAPGGINLTDSGHDPAED